MVSYVHKFEAKFWDQMECSLLEKDATNIH
jgi:hypothetical protein